MRMSRMVGMGALVAVLGGAPAQAQEPSRVVIEPVALALDLDQAVTVRARVLDASGTTLVRPVSWFSGSRRSVSVDSTGRVTGLRPGEFAVFVQVAGTGIRAELPVTVRWPAIQTVAVTGGIRGESPYYQGVTSRHRAVVTDTRGTVRKNAEVRWASDDPSVVAVNRFGDVTAVAPGSATILATAGGVTGSLRVTVAPNPVRSLEVTSSAEGGRTGDVITFRATARDAAGAAVTVPVTWAVHAMVEDTVIAPGAAAFVDPEGRFVANRAGRFQVVASIGARAASRTVEIGHRHQSARINAAVGQGAVSQVHTSDLWVWEGKDGRDYAVTGTWGAAGAAYFWDVTNPAAPVLTDSIVVDARTVNDVKVDAARGICVITREGASNRRNGFVVLDCGNPRDVKVLSRFDDGLVGGVHNVFLYDNHLYAINAGRRFDIISLEDPTAPRRVGFFELDTPGHGIHDVWVEDGIAYTSNWGDGVAMVDVGNGIAGGSVERPVLIGSYAYPIGATHAAFPWRSASAGGKLYLFVGDEQFPHDLPDDGPDEAGGYVHIVDFTDPRSPHEVARYQVPEAGPHNLWVENDTLYVAYYNAGVRVVDVSGELLGNLYEQGRELARFKAHDPTGFVPNAGMAWGPQPFKGHLFFSDFNSGLWAVKLPARSPPPVP